MALTNRERQAAFYARGRSIPRVLGSYRLALEASYKLGRADAEAGLPVRTADDIPLPEIKRHD